MRDHRIPSAPGIGMLLALAGCMTLSACSEPASSGKEKDAAATASQPTPPAQAPADASALDEARTTARDAYVYGVRRFQPVNATACR